MATENMTISALGRPFTLGMLYDARRDMLFPGLTLWNDAVLQKHTSKTTQQSSTFQITASDTIESKSSLLDVNASLKASFLSGLIEVGGSANYLNDTKKFKNQSRVTFKYNATTHFQQLILPQGVAINTGNIEKTSATHVVTGIVYGATAFFVFDTDKLDASNVRNIEGSMEAVIKKIPFVDIEGRAGVKLSEEEKNLTNKFSCKFHGDLVLKSNPATFEDAVKTYVELPQVLGANGENSVPLKVFLMPLKNLDTKAAQLISGISVGLVRKMQDALEDLREMKMRCSESLEEPMVGALPQIKDDIRRFQNICDDYESNLKQTMAKAFPLIRDGKEKESVAEKILQARDKSPFSHANLDKWLDDKEREINIVKSCIDTIAGAKIVQSQSELDRAVLTAGLEHALCFVFTCLECADPCLDAMSQYLDSKTVQSTKKDQWYYSSAVISKLREKAEVVRDFAEQLRNSRQFAFLVAAIDNHKYSGATIYHYKRGILVTDDFTRPVVPPVHSVTDRADLIWYATDLTLDPNTVNNYLTLSERNKKVTCGNDWKNYPDHPERFDKHCQVLCMESLSGRHYWEIQFSNGPDDSVYILAGYKRVARKGKGMDAELGGNSSSWSFGQRTDFGVIRSYYKNVKWERGMPSGGLGKVGVFLDWPAGTMSFYKVSGNKLSHLYTVTARFYEALVPGIWCSHTNNHAHICPM